MPVYLGSEKVSISPKIVVEGGGGGAEGQFLVRVVDYDGTVLKSAKLDEGETFTLPEAPSHTGLTFVEWSSPVTITNSTVTVTNSDINIGAVYDTTSELSEFDLTFKDDDSLTITFNMTGTKNWGDGTSDTTNSHTYSSTGSYTITCDGDFVSDSRIFGSNNLNVRCTNARISSSITEIPYACFQNCQYLQTITLPNTIGSLSYTFDECTSLKALVIPSGVTEISTVVYNCTCLTAVVLPSTLETITYEAFYNTAIQSITLPAGVYYDVGDHGLFESTPLISITFPGSMEGLDYGYRGLLEWCTSLKFAIIGEGITYIGDDTFKDCANLTHVVAPSTLTEISSGAFWNCHSVMEYDFTACEEVPWTSSTAFYGINPNCKIKVPASLYEDWIAETNWSLLADQIEAV